MIKLSALENFFGLQFLLSEYTSYSYKFYYDLNTVVLQTKHSLIL